MGGRRPSSLSLQFLFLSLLEGNAKRRCLPATCGFNLVNAGSHSSPVVSLIPGHFNRSVERASLCRIHIQCTLLGQPSHLFNIQFHIRWFIDLVILVRTRGTFLRNVGQIIKSLDRLWMLDTLLAVQYFYILQFIVKKRHFLIFYDHRFCEY